MERERKLRQLALLDQLEKEKTLSTFKLQQELIQKEDEKHYQFLLDKEKENSLAKAKERLKIIEMEKRKLELEKDEYRDHLKEIS